jgi:8-oxo-dGTP pyrophosphatase MutT (NUDIX family)
MVRANDDFDPAAVPIRPAATVMLVADRPDLHVLMLRRSARQVFAGDMWVYPGGAVDPEDADRVGLACRGLDDVAASARLRVAHGGLAYWVAAVRECFEEAGVLFAEGPADPGAASRLAEHRRALNARERLFPEIVAAEGLALHVDRLHYVAHWITPFGSPRRFDTRFFLAAFPEGQVAAHDEEEAVHHEWVRPAEAVERWRRDRMAMMSPTARMLMSLARFSSAEEAVRGAAAATEPHQVRVRHDGATYHVLLPGDPGYDEGDGEREFGWVALRPPG